MLHDEYSNEMCTHAVMYCSHFLLNLYTVILLLSRFRYSQIILKSIGVSTVTELIISNLFARNVQSIRPNRLEIR